MELRELYMILASTEPMQIIVPLKTFDVENHTYIERLVFCADLRRFDIISQRRSGDPHENRNEIITFKIVESILPKPEGTRIEIPRPSFIKVEFEVYEVGENIELRPEALKFHGENGGPIMDISVSHKFVPLMEVSIFGTRDTSY